MIAIHGWADIRSDARQRVAAEAITMQATSHAEPGCVHYGLSWAADDPNRICLLEIWEDADAYEGHKASEHGRAFTAVANESVAAPPTFIRYDASPV